MPPAQPGAPGAPGTFIVLTRGNDADEVVVRTLVGEYVEKGSNHGRKVYQKASDKSGPDFVDVFLYYWDHRDGPAFEGWWFGNKLGGTQVWSHCTSSEMLPPSTGWKIPWDGPVRATLIVMPKADQQRQEAEEKVRMLSGEVAKFDGPARQALEQARAAAGDFTSPASLQHAEQLLAPHAGPLAELQRKVTEAQRGVGGAALQVFSQLVAQVHTTNTAVAAELTKIRGTRAKVEQEVKTREAELKDNKLFQELIPEATEKTNSAEDAVEKASITAEMIAAGGENLEEVCRAVAETETAAKQAQSAIGEARIYLNAKQAAVKRFESEKIRSMAATELAKLQQQLQESQNKLNPIKSARQDFLARQAAKKTVDEILETVTPTELDCDRAEEATNLLNGNGLNKELLAQAEHALKKANDQVAACLRLIAQKKTQAAGVVLTEITKMEDRVKVAENRLSQLKGSHKEAAERVTCELLLREAAEKLQAVQEAVAKAADTEGPFLMGVEELPLEETLSTVKACESAATSANTSASICRMFIATKLVEAKRFSPKPSNDAQAKLRELQKQLEAYTRKLGDLKKATAERKGKALMREAESHVAEAENLTKQMAEAAAIFEDDTKLCEAPPGDIRVAADETQKAEVVASAALAEARQFLTARQIEAKGKDASVEISAELIKYQTRLSTAQGEVAKWRKLASTCEQRLAAKRVVEDAKGRITTADESVKQVAELVAGLDGEEKTDADTKAAELAAAECQNTLKTVMRFLETQSRAQSAAKDELAKLQMRVKQLQERLEESHSAMRDRAERQVVKAIVAESEEHVREAEESVRKVTEAEAPFLTAEGELPLEQATSALLDLDTTAASAHTVVGSTKTFVAMKRLTAKRLSENSMAACNEELNKLQVRLDALTKRLSDIRKGMATRKHATVKREVMAKIAVAEQLTNTAKEATKSLIDANNTKEQEAPTEEPDHMKAACEKAGSAQAEAANAIEATKNLVMQRQQDVKASSNDAAALTDLTKMLDQLNRLQQELETQKGLLRDQEHKFVAARLLQDALAQIESLETKMEALTQTAAPLVSDQKEDFLASVWLTHIMEALSKHAASKSISREALFSEMGAQDGKLSEAKFAAFIQELPDLCEQKDPLFSPEEVKAAFKRAGGLPGGELELAHFLDQFRRKFVVTSQVSMTESIEVKGSKTLRKIDIDELVEALEEPTKDDGLSLLRVRAKAEKDGKEGYVTISGNQGTVYLEPYSPYTACEKRVERALQEMAEAVSETAKHVDRKADELRNVKTGPLAETKVELQKLKPRVTKVQFFQSGLKKKVQEAQKRHNDSIAAEKKRRQEAVDRRTAKNLVEESNALVNKLQERVEQVIPSAEALVKSRGADLESPLNAMAVMDKDLQALKEQVDKGDAMLKGHLDEMKSSAKGPFSEARSVLVKLKVRLGSFDSRCQKQMTALKLARKQVESDAAEAITSVLRRHMRQKQMAPDALVKQLCEGGTCISQTQLRDFLQKLQDPELKPTQMELGLERYKAGMSKLSLLGTLQEYSRCVKEIAMTSAFEVKEGKTVRKLAVAELVEVLGDQKVESVTALSRARCHALLDGKEGFVSLKGNHGTSFLERCAKPYYSCDAEAEIHEAFETSSPEVRRMQPGEVMEVLEGPRREESRELVRLRGMAKKDATQGWVTLKDDTGKEYLEVKKLLVCMQTVAVTANFDIGEGGKALRKLAVGETMEALEESKEDPIRNLTRMKIRASRDSKEGWVTIKGNHGTAYVQESDKYYMCKASVALEGRFPSGSKAVRMLEEGELFEASELPKVETKEGASRVRGRSLSSGSEGWFTLASGKLSPWSPHYRCDASTELTEALDTASPSVIRTLVPGETLEALNAPVVDEPSGALRVQVRADKDGATGFATVRGPQGLPFLYAEVES